MEFGRVPDPSRIDFTLPPEPDENVEVLAALGARGVDEPAPRVILGAPVWNHDGFMGRIYPKGTPRREYLHHYARQFPAIELNTSFYGIDVGRPYRVTSDTQASVYVFTRIEAFFLFIFLIFYFSACGGITACGVRLRRDGG